MIYCINNTVSISSDPLASLDTPKTRRAAVGDFVNVRLVRACGFDFDAELA